MKRTITGAAVFLAVLSLTGIGMTQEPFEPIVNRHGQAGLEYTESAKTLGMGRLAFSAFGNMSLDNAFVRFVNLDPVNYNLTPKAAQYDLMPALGFGLAPFLDFSAALPLYIDNMSKYDSLWPGTKSFGGPQGGFGDLELQLKLQLPPHRGPRVFDMAYLAGVSLPTGDKSRGYFPRHTYYLLKDTSTFTQSGDSARVLSSCYSSRIAELQLKLLFTFSCWEHGDVIPFLLHVNLGARVLAARGFDQALLLNLAAEYRPASWISLFTEASAEPRLGSITQGFKVGNDPLRISPGIVFHTLEGLYFSLGADWGLSSHDPLAYEVRRTLIAARVQPDFRLFGSVGWCGFLYKAERGAKKPKAPKTFDSDSDGIPDSLDKCPQVPEDKDGFEDEDGCPDLDNDKDRVPDSLDKCFNEPEDYDGFEDQDGCPDLDNDKDGVPDSLDRCPGMPEDRDGFEDSDGCPDYDNDLDGVPDSLDKCPDVTGTPDNNGCPKPVQEAPKIKEIKRGRLILRGVEFKPGTVDLASESYQKLDEVFESLKAYPQVNIEISGYTDNAGNAAANRKLSLRRAETVRAYLILRGLDPSRITAVGRGGEDPVTDNNTPEGRAFNRRIEIKRTN